MCDQQLAPFKPPAHGVAACAPQTAISLIAKQVAVCLHANCALWQDGMLVRDSDLLPILCEEEHW